MSEHNETPTNEPSSDEELDDLFLSPEDSEGEIVAEVDASGDVQPGSAAEDTDAEVIEMNAAPSAAAQAPAVAQVSSAELDAANETIRGLEEERDEVKGRMMRVAADLENFRKRTAREREDMRKYGIDKVILELLPVLDNLERALQHAENNAEDNSITEGVRMVYRQFLTALEKHGVKSFESKGDAFDPQKHEAIQQVETDEHDTGTVLEQYQKGYFLHDRLIRPAMVSVAKKVTTPEATEPADDVVEPELIEVEAAEVEPSSPDAEPNEADSEAGTAGPTGDVAPNQDEDQDEGQDHESSSVGVDEGLVESTDVGT